jgi:hypothetical protein
VTEDRPAAPTLLPFIFDRWQHVRSQVRPRVVAEMRCPRRGHLVAVVVKTAHGLWAAWWQPDTFTSHPGLDLTRWECAWVDDSIRNAGCACATGTKSGLPARRRWIVPLYWLAEQHGTVLARMR